MKKIITNRYFVSLNSLYILMSHNSLAAVHIKDEIIIL